MRWLPTMAPRAAYPAQRAHEARGLVSEPSVGRRGETPEEVCLTSSSQAVWPLQLWSHPAQRSPQACFQSDAPLGLAAGCRGRCADLRPTHCCLLALLMLRDLQGCALRGMRLVDLSFI